MKCWATCLGDCNGPQSNEHYFSENLFKSGKVIVEGVPWQDAEKKEYPISALTANILCESHNNRLSPYDSAAGLAWDKLNRLNNLQNHRNKFPNTKSWNFISERIDGKLFERWVAKTAINLFCIIGKGSRWALTVEKPLSPPTVLVEAVYGLREFEKPFGLYIQGAAGEQITFSESVGFQSIFDKHKNFSGGIITFKGFRFLIWLSSQDAPFLSQYPYRLKRFQFMHVYNDKYKLSHSLKFDWT